MVVGDFDGPNHTGTRHRPSKKQLTAVENLLDYLIKHAKLNLDSSAVYGHSSFGKPDCPGISLENLITSYRRQENRE